MEYDASTIERLHVDEVEKAVLPRRNGAQDFSVLGDKESD